MWRPKVTTDISTHIAANVARAQEGNSQARDDLIDSLSGWVLSVARTCSGKALDNSAEEYSVALLALNEAINSYVAGKGASFLTFAEIVIKRRLVDYVRKNARVRELPRSSLAITATGEEAEHIPAEVSAAQEHYRDSLLAEDRRLEIASLSAQLASFGLSFADLPAQTPKHADARSTAIGVAALLVRDGALWEDCLNKKLLPVGTLCERSMLSRKTIERHRKYIIAAALILGGDYPLLRQYLGVNNHG